VWTGRQMIGWGGGCCGEAFADGSAYTAATNSWRGLPTAPLVARSSTAGAWTGTEMIVAGGQAGEAGHDRILADAAAYNPATRAWRTLPPMPQPRTGATAVWDGTEVLFVGGWHIVGNKDVWFARGLALNPTTNRWRWLPAMEFPRAGHVAVWSGNQLLVWGGATEGPAGADRVPPHGEAYEPATNAWSPLPEAPLRGRTNPIAVWTGDAMIVWGGESVQDHPFADGAALMPGVP
jgi:N-acetylneuraminic acid mutarotase